MTGIGSNPCAYRLHPLAECAPTQLGKRKILDSLIRRSKIFGVEIHSRFDTESIEIDLEPLVGSGASHVVKMQQARRIPHTRRH